MPPSQVCVLKPAQRAVPGGREGRRPAVVAEEENQRVLFQMMFAELGQHRANRIVHGRLHGGIGAASLVRNAREAGKILLGGLQRRMNRVEGEVTKPWFRLVFLDEVYRPRPKASVV